MTQVPQTRVGDVLRLERIPVNPDPMEDYSAIGVRSFGRGLFHYEPAPGNKLGSLRFFALRRGRLVISNIKGWEGAVALSDDVDAECVASNRFLIYDAINGSVDLSWARWFFLSEPGNEMIQRASPGSADRNRTLSVDRFENLIIPLPPIEEQRRVAAKLDKVRGLVNRVAELAGRSVALARAFAPACASASHRSADDKLGDGWEPLRLGEVLKPASDQVLVDVHGSYPNLGIYGFGRGVFAKPPIMGDATSARTLFRVHAGQFIYSRLFAFEGAYADVPDAFDGYFVSNEFPSFDPDPGRLDARWLASYLRSPVEWSALAANSVGLGVRRQRVPVESVLAHQVMLPPIDQQRSMMRQVERADKVLASQRSRDAMARALLPAMLNREFGALT